MFSCSFLTLENDNVKKKKQSEPIAPSGVRLHRASICGKDFILQFCRETTFQVIFGKLSLHSDVCEASIPLKGQQGVMLTVEMILNLSGYLFL